MTNNTYLNNLMTNQTLETDSMSSFTENIINNINNKPIKILKQKNKPNKKKLNVSFNNKSSYYNIGGKGGNVVGEEKTNSDTGSVRYRPHGGFPPIYICDKNTKEENITKEREYVSHKNTVSIKDIMKTRRDITPFISI